MIRGRAPRTRPSPPPPLLPLLSLSLLLLSPTVRGEWPMRDDRLAARQGAHAQQTLCPSNWGLRCWVPAASGRDGGGMLGYLGCDWIPSVIRDHGNTKREG